MLRFVPFALALTAPAFAQSRQAETGQPPQRIRDVTVTGDQRCPDSTTTEVIVCHRLDEPYRIPKALREDGPVPAANQSWVNRASAADQVSRVAGGLPDTCSAIGTGGQSGCAMQINQQWAAGQRAKRAETSATADTAAVAAGSSSGR